MDKYVRLILIFSLIAFLVSVFFIFGCRTKEENKKEQSYLGVELNYYKLFDESDVIESYLDEFMLSKPGLKINYRKFNNFDEYLKTILNEMAEGKGPDLFSMQNTWFASNLAKIAPMPEYLATPADFEKAFVAPAYRDLVRVDVDGKEKIFALPMTVDSLALYYNKDHFEDRLPAKGRPSSTWAELQEDIKILTKEGRSNDIFEVSGIALGRAENISLAVDILYLLFLQYGVDFYNSSMSEAIFAGRHGSLGTYAGLDALAFFVSFADPKSSFYTWNEFSADRDSREKEVQAFARGKISMIIGYASTYKDILNEISLLKSWGEKYIDKSAIRVAPIPQLEDPEISKSKRITYANYFAETVSRNSQHQDLAWELVAFLTSKKVLADYFEKTGRPTSRREMIADQIKDPIYGIFVSQSGYAQSFPLVDYSRYREIFSRVIQNANSNRANRASLLEAQKLINNMLSPKGFINDKKDSTKEKKKGGNKR